MQKNFNRCMTTSLQRSLLAPASFTIAACHYRKATPMKESREVAEDMTIEALEVAHITVNSAFNFQRYVA